MALVKAAAENEIVLIKKTKNEVVIDDLGQERTYKIIREFPFNSARKSQSVILEDEEGNQMLYSKGADLQMKDKVEWMENEFDVVDQHLTKFAVLGLRTLVMAQRELDRGESEKICETLDALE